jgi:hypothetical protein
VNAHFLAAYTPTLTLITLITLTPTQKLARVEVEFEQKAAVHEREGLSEARVCGSSRGVDKNEKDA